MLPKCIPKTVGSVPFCHHFGDIFRRSAFLCIVAARWLPFWLPLAPFWFPMAIFRSPFGALWLTFAHLRALFYRRPGFSCNSPIKIQVVHSAVAETRLCRAKDYIVFNVLNFEHIKKYHDPKNVKNQFCHVLTVLGESF